MFKYVGLFNESSRSSVDFDSSKVGLENTPQYAPARDKQSPIKLSREKKKAKSFVESTNFNSPTLTLAQPAVKDMGLPPLDFRVSGKKMQEVVDYYLPIVYELQIPVSEVDQMYAQQFVKWYQLHKTKNLSEEEGIAKRNLQSLLLNRMKNEKNKALKMLASVKANDWQMLTLSLKMRIDQQFENFNKFYKEKFINPYLEGLLVDLRENHKRSTSIFETINSYIAEHLQKSNTISYTEKIEELRSYLLQTACDQEKIIYEFHRVYDCIVEDTAPRVVNTNWQPTEMPNSNPISFWFVPALKVEAEEVDYVKLFTNLGSP